MKTKAVIVTGLLCLLLFSVTPYSAPGERDTPIAIGSRLELFVDHFLIGQLKGTQLKLHRPQCSLTSHDQPSGYYATVIKDESLYRGYHRDYKPSYAGRKYDGNPGEITVYWESHDGIKWLRPNLGLFEINGSTENNVILADLPPFSHNFTPFLDTRPGVPASERFKAVAGTKVSGLVAFVSGDGIHWQKLREEPILPPSEETRYDSQNVAFWSPSEERYLCFFRTFKQVGDSRYRWISRSASKDFLNWTEPKEIEFGDAPPEHLYTNGTHPYFRAPHIYISLATRFFPDRGNSTDVVLITSRIGQQRDRTFLEAFIRPGLDERRWTNRANYVALNVVPTGPAEMSIYMRDVHFVLRIDGFISVRAPYSGGEMTTKPLVFAGKELVINYSTSAAGSIRVEVQNADGQPWPGFTLEDSTFIVGDSVSRVVSWKKGSDLSRLAGEAIRLRFQMKDADLYSIQFRL